MARKSSDLETKLLRRKIADVQREARKLCRFLNERQTSSLDAAFGQVLALLSSIDAELSGSNRQIGFGAGIKCKR